MKSWHAYVGDKQYGPVGEDVLKRWISQGRIGPEDYIWTEGMADWIKACEAMPEMFGPAGPTAAGVSMTPKTAPGGTTGQTPNYQITAQARQCLSSRWGLPIAFSLLLFLLSMAISMIPYVSGLISLVITGPLQLGAIIFYITFTRGAQPRLGMMFEGFKNFGNALGAYLLMGLFVFLWMIACALPGLAVLAIAAAMENQIAIGFAFILAAVPGMLAAIIAQLRYSQTFYVLADNITSGPLEAINTSKAMMVDRKGKLFCLGLRFIGWYLLCILTLGIGFLWLVPYMSVAFARFYDDLQTPLAQEAQNIQTSPSPQPDTLDAEQ